MFVFRVFFWSLWLFVQEFSLDDDIVRTFSRLSCLISHIVLTLVDLSLLGLLILCDIYEI